MSGPTPASAFTEAAVWDARNVRSVRNLLPEARNHRMSDNNLGWIANFIWGIADDVFRDVYVRGKYRDVILLIGPLGNCRGMA